jgi:hypothetical protein
MLRETHAACDRKQNRTAGLQGGGELRPKNDLQAKPTHCASRRARGAIARKTRLGFGRAAPSPRQLGEDRTFRAAWPAVIECNARLDRRV